MSAESATLSAFAAPRAGSRADATPEEKLEWAARVLLAGGEVKFKLSTRVHAPTLPPGRRVVVEALRRLPAWLYVPPALATQRGTFDYWNWILAKCKSPDDQILVMPHNRTYEAGVEDVAVECRPRDPQDAARFRVLSDVFGHLVRDEGERYITIKESTWMCVKETAERLVEKCSRV